MQSVPESTKAACEAYGRKTEQKALSSDSLVIVEQRIGYIAKESRILWWKEAASDFINALLQLGVVLVVVTRVVTEQN